MREIYKININLILILFALFIILIKFFLPYVFYSGEDIIIRQLSELKGSQYLPIIRSYSEFNFAPTYELDNFNNGKILAFPYLALILHTISFKLFGINSFFFIEFIATSIFLIIFYNIFKHLNFNKFLAIFLSIFFFIIPNIINELKFLEFDLLNIISQNLINLYDTRLPRPLITNLYFYAYILILLKIYNDKKYTLKRSLLLGLLNGISLHSFFYFAFIELTLFLLVIFYLNKGQLNHHIYKNKKFYFIFIISNLFFLIILFVNLRITSIDNLKVIGFHSINFDQKLILIKYFFNYIFNKYFLILFIINLLLFYSVKKIEKNFIILYFLYIASIIAFLFFIIISNKSIHYYFFQHWVLITGILFFIISIVKILYNKYFINKNLQTVFFYLFFLMLIFVNYTHYKDYNKDDLDRININELISFVQKDNYFNDDKIKILTFDTKIFTALLLKNFKNFVLVPNSFWTTRSINEIENNLIGSFKILGLNKNDFINYFENTMIEKRIINPNTSSFFGFIYQANSIIRFDEINDYTQNDLNIIEFTSPFLTEQLAIPKNEFKRLIEKFERVKNSINYPDIIIINKNSYIGKNYSINMKKYCQFFINDTFIVYKNRLYCR